jgi:hypothetical protein
MGVRGGGWEGMGKGCEGRGGRMGWDGVGVEGVVGGDGIRV